MKRHISIFALLLCAFATVGAWQATASVNIVCGEKVTLSYGQSSKQLTISAAGNEGWYNVFSGDMPVTAPDGPPSDPSGTYRVEWLTLSENDTDTSGENSKLSSCTQLITGNRTITVGQMASAKTSAWTYYYGNSLIALKYIKRCTVSTLVSPETSGTVTGGGTYDEGANVTLTAKANDGYEFKNWNGDLSKTETTYVIDGLSEDETVTAYFKAKSYSIGKSAENSTVEVADSATYDGNLSISWGPSVEAGYDYAFSSVQVMSGSTVLKKFTDGTSGTFNMKTDAGRYYSSVTVKVVYNKTPQNRNLTLTFPATGIAQIGYKIGVANEWTYVTTTTQVPVPVGTKWQAYAVPADGYKTATSETKPQSGTMGANGAEFAPTAELDGFLLTVDPNGDPQKKDAKFHGNSEPYTYSTRLRSGMATLNALDDVATKADGAVLIEYRDSNGEAVYDAQGHNLKGTYWTEDYPAGVFQGTGNLTVKAIWGTPPEHCTITATCEPVAGGTVEPASTNVIKGKTVTLTATENTGYSFKCWETGGETVSTDKSYSFTANADATYVAVFTGKVYTVTFKAFDAKPSSQTREYTHGQPYGSFPTVTPDNGYKFDGWYDNDDFEGDPITETSIVTATDNKFKLYAKCTEKTEFDVIFVDKDGGNGAVTNKNMATGTEIASLVPTTWTRKYYTLVGWDPPLPETVGSSDLEFTAVWWSIGQNILDCSNLVFEATGNWKPFEDNTAVGGWCMRMDALGGTDNLTAVLTESGTLTFDWKGNGNRVLNVKLGDVQTNFTFKGSDWQKETIPVVVEQGASIDLQFTCTDPWVVDDFCAIDHVTWTPGVPVETYVVTYDKGAYGVGEGRTDTKTNGVDLLLAGALFTRDNYMQDGWSKNEGGMTSDYALGGTYAENAPITLYPHWLEKGKYTVSYSAGTDATGSAEAQTAHEGETVDLHGDGHFSRTGYSQDGWATSDRGAKAFDFNETYDKNVSTTLYPCWTNNRYTVTFNSNGGSVTPAAKAVTYDEAYGELPTLDDRVDYKFDGWALASDEKVTAETIVKTSADHELIAKWTKDLGPYSKALDCENLDFVATGGWTVFTNKSFAKQGVSCLSNSVQGAVLSTTVAESGTLKFYWRGAPNDENSLWLKFKIGDEVKAELQVNRGGDEIVWTEIEAHVDLSAEVPKTLSFACVMCGEYCALDYFTWTPDGGGHPEPVDGEDNVTISSAAVSGGKCSLSFQSDERFDYNLLTNANLLINSWGVMKTLIGDGKVLTFEPQIIEGLPQLFYKVETIQKKD